MKSVFLHQVHHLAGPKVVTFHPQHFIAIVEVEIDAAAREVLLEQRHELPRMHALVYIRFENLYAFGF